MSAVDKFEKDMIAKGVLPLANNNVADRERWYLRMATEQYKEFLHQPTALAKLLFLKATRTFFATEDRPSAHLPLILLQIPTLVLAIYGIIRLWKQPEMRIVAQFLILYIGYYYGAVTAALPFFRYFAPAIPLLLAAAAIGLVGLIPSDQASKNSEPITQ